MECPEPDALSAMAAGALSRERRAAIANHAAECEACHAALDALLRSREADEGELAGAAGNAATVDRAMAETLPEVEPAPRVRGCGLSPAADGRARADATVSRWASTG